MQCSHNELEMTLRKAVIGAGFTVGTAVEAARAGLWLCRHDCDGAGAVLAGVGRPPATPTCAQTAAGWLFAKTQAVVAGAAALDHVLADAGGAAVVCDDIDVPLLLIGFAGDAAERTGRTLAVDCEGRSLVISPRMAHAVAAAWAGEKRMTLRCAEATQDGEAPGEPLSRISVNGQTWREILDLAARTYVPASDASRLHGAGAGLTDND